MSEGLLLLLPVALVAVVLLALRGRSKSEVDDGPPPNAIVVDGSNVMHWGGDPSAKVLRQVLSSLERHGYTPVVFFDANAGYKLGDHYFDPLKLAKVTGIKKEHICVVDKGVIADEMILSFARDHGLRIVTNDQFRDWRVQFPIAAKKGQLIKGTFREGAVVWRGKL